MKPGAFRRQRGPWRHRRRDGAAGGVAYRGSGRGGARRLRRRAVTARLAVVDRGARLRHPARGRVWRRATTSRCSRSSRATCAASPPAQPLINLVDRDPGVLTMLTPERQRDAAPAPPGTGRRQRPRAGRGPRGERLDRPPRPPRDERPWPADPGPRRCQRPRRRPRARPQLAERRARGPEATHRQGGRRAGPRLRDRAHHRRHDDRGHAAVPRILRGPDRADQRPQHRLPALALPGDLGRRPRRGPAARGDVAAGPDRRAGAGRVPRRRRLLPARSGSTPRPACPAPT